MDNIPELARLMHESLEQLGWQVDAVDLAKRVSRLNIGLPLEDEFSIICGWLGKCELIHKLDQAQYPKSSRDTYQVPDLLATFKTGQDKTRTVLIEVKSSNDNVLSFKPDYIEKLKAYANLCQLPLMIAWKFYSFWALVPIEEFKIARKNHNLSFNIAITKSHMGSLVGDFSYHLESGAGFHLKNKIIERLSSSDSDNSQEYKVAVEECWYTNGAGERVADISSLAQKVVLSWQHLIESSTVSDTHIVFHNICDTESSMMAHMNLVYLLSLKNIKSSSLNWRSLLVDDTSTLDLQNFREGVNECLRLGIVRYIFEIAPVENSNS